MSLLETVLVNNSFFTSYIQCNSDQISMHANFYFVDN